MNKFSYQSMGTGWEISIWDDITDDGLEKMKEEVFAMSDNFDKTYSRFIKTSLVWKIAEGGAGMYEVPEDFTRLLQIYFDFYELSEKKLNPLIGFTISDMGYDAEYSLVPKENIRLTPDLADTVLIIDKTHIETKQAVLFDFGAAGKGYFVDRIADFLKTRGFKRFLVNGSGDIYYQGDEPIKVGLENPDNTNEVIDAIDIRTGAMCASGTNRRRWRQYHHVINPLSNQSTKFVSATWVVAENAALADTIASCLFFVAPEALSKYSFEYCVMSDEKKLKRSPGFLSSQARP